MTAGVTSPRAPLIVAVAAAVACALGVRGARADAWWGQDKALHFGLSAALAGGAYGVGVACCETRGWGLAIGGSVGLGAGIAKELLDLAGLGDPSWRDLAWDAAGVAVGLGVALLVDVAARGSSGWTRARRTSALGPGPPRAFRAPRTVGPWSPWAGE